MYSLSDSIRNVKGIGPKKAALFNKLGIVSLYDALNYFPREYEQRGAVQPVSSIRDGQEASLCIEFDGSPRVNRIRRGFSTTILKGHDDTGHVECIWFNQPFRGSLYKQDKKYFVLGRAEKRPNGIMQIQNPAVEEYDASFHNTDRLLPVYRLTHGLTQRDLRGLTEEAVGCISGELNLNNFTDPVDRYMENKYGLMNKREAYANMHYPKDAVLQESARKRLAFDEFLVMQTAVRYIKAHINNMVKGICIKTDSPEIVEFLNSLPFRLTDSQNKVLSEVFDDMSGNTVMNRLIQGDVGSGKTVIAAAALYAAAKSGFQGVMMAPTEILARQHYETLVSLMADTDVHIALLTGSMTEAEKKPVKEALSEGRIDILLGTHAVIQEDVVYNNLGLVITDEQHRFGVRQRAMLQNKGSVPHMMVMSATPIPRTLAHIVHGDLDLSVIDTMPPGRTPVKTYHVTSEYRQRIYNFVKKHTEEGSQAYIVCPLVEESEKLDLRSASEIFDELSKGWLKGVSMALLHGRLRPDEKERIMESFAEGNIKVLVSTTVIEVGVNVPNAVLMIIENAERFGLAQLHQLRGRVGRGDKQSFCILISDIKDEAGKQRFKALVETNNGFEIAEKDLQLRGPGDLYGVRQHGLPDFKAANPIKDNALFNDAQEAADDIISRPDEEMFASFIKKSIERFNRMTEGIAAN